MLRAQGVVTVSNDQGSPPPRGPSRRGVAIARVRYTNGEPAVRCLVAPRPLTPVRVRSDASYTSAAGLLHLSLVPGIYVLTAHGLDASGAQVTGESEEVTADAGQTIVVPIVVD